MDFSDTYSADKPITSSEQDQLQRAQFANQIAYSIINRRNTEGLVIGLYGEWGEGKSSVLNLVEQAIRIEKEQNETLKIALVKFNPWRYTHEEALLRRFFSILALSVKTYDENEELKKGILQVRDIYYGSNVQFEDDERNEEELQRIISTILEDKQIKIVISIDDIDRLDKDEIYALFRLVKLNANFSNTTYLLAFDKNVVADALGERFGSSGKQAGFDFIEKIIQVPLSLPKLTSNRLLEYCLSNIKELTVKENINLNNDNWRYLRTNLEPVLTRHLTTPRVVIRFVNSIAFSIPLMRGEVNLLHLFILEALKMFYPDVYEFLAKSENSYSIESQLEKIDNKVEIAKNESLSKLLSNLSSFEQEDIIRLLVDLFKANEKSYEHWHVNDNYFFRRYFSYYIPESQLSFKKFSRLVHHSLEMPNDKLIEEIRKTGDLWHLKKEINSIDEDAHLASKIKLVAAFNEVNYGKYHNWGDIKTIDNLPDFYAFIDTYKKEDYNKCNDFLVNLLCYRPAKFTLWISKKDKDIIDFILNPNGSSDRPKFYLEPNFKCKKQRIIKEKVKDIEGKNLSEEQQQWLNKLLNHIFDDRIFSIINNFDKRLLIFTEFQNGRKILTNEQYHLLFRLLKSDFKSFQNHYKFLSKEKNEENLEKKIDRHFKTFVTVPYAEIWSFCRRKEFLDFISLQISNEDRFIDTLIRDLVKFRETKNDLTKDKFNWLVKYYDIDKLYESAINFIDKEVVKKEYIEYVNDSEIFKNKSQEEKENFIRRMVEEKEEKVRQFITYCELMRKDRVFIQNTEGKESI